MREKGAVPDSLPYASPEALDVLELVGDGRAAPLSASDAARVAGAAARAGRAEARRWADVDLGRHLAEKGVEVRILGSSPSWAAAGARLCALTVYDRRRRGERRVDLYLDELSRKCALLARLGVVVCEDGLTSLHLAHEFYHFIELSERRLASELVPEVLVRGALGRRRARPARASEVAAHAFAREVTGFSLHPTLVDALARLSAGELDQSTFEKDAREACDAVLALRSAALEDR